MAGATTTMAVLGMAGAGLGAFGQYQSGQDAKNQAEYNAKVAQQEAGLIRTSGNREVDIIRQNAILDEYRQRKSLRESTGTQVARYAKSGVAFTGSPLDAIADSISNAELEISIGQWNARNNAATTAWNTENAARGAESTASMRRWEGGQAARAGTTKALSTLLTSGTESYSKIKKEK